MGAFARRPSRQRPHARLSALSLTNQSGKRSGHAKVSAMLFGLGMTFIYLLLPPVAVHGFELKTKHASVVYQDIDTLKKFNHELYMGRLKRKIKKSDTLDEEVKNKLEYIVEKVMMVVDMHRTDLKFKIVIHRSKDGVKKDFKRLFGVDVDYIAFYAPAQNIVFYSAEHSNLRVVAHEIGHVVAENYFQVSPPPRIHEVMAQYAEKHVTD